jgi:hypothetical protein
MTARPLFFTAHKPSHSRWLWVALLPLLALLVWVYEPVTRGDFVADDYVFLTTARMVNTPFAAFWQSHFYEPYYFRPIGVLSWWGATALFGLEYAPHSAVNLGLHMVNSCLLFALLRALALRASAVFAGVTLFAIGPVALATLLWPSNRFDLLAAGFLLAQAIAMLRALRGSRLALVAAMLAALAACWSKELAYPVATVMACLALTARSALWTRRITLFAALGLAIAGAFAVRHAVVSDAYAFAGTDLITQITGGAAVMISSWPRLIALIVGEASAAVWGWAIVAALLLALVGARRAAGAAQSDGATSGLIGGAFLVFIAAFIVQTPLAKNFAIMLDGGAFGSITFARFYYAPWLAASAVLALLLARTRARWGGALALAVAAATLAAALSAKPLAESFAQWTREVVKPVAVAATHVVDASAPPLTGFARARDGEPCYFVLLGTQTQHPYFRMFSDVTVKARTARPEATWSCWVMTESTPWLFALPLFGQINAPPETALRPVPGADGKPKPDSTWSSIRYRYRLPAKDVASLTGARFFDWRGDKFVEVTEEVQRGTRKVTLHDW